MTGRQGRMKIIAIAVIEKLGTTLNVQLLADRLDSLQAPLPEQELKPYTDDSCASAAAHSDSLPHC